MNAKMIKKREKYIKEFGKDPGTGKEINPLRHL